jgi:hypothetical protein
LSRLRLGRVMCELSFIIIRALTMSLVVIALGSSFSKGERATILRYLRLVSKRRSWFAMRFIDASWVGVEDTLNDFVTHIFHFGVVENYQANET